MLELRFHGRGGQGTVNAAQLLAKAVVMSGGYAQFIPAFGVERKGSPVFGYFRMDDKIIWPKTQVYEPDGVVILDDSLMPQVSVFEGLRDGGFVVLNTMRPAELVPLPKQARLYTGLDATDIARKTIGREIPNTVMLGALARTMGCIDADVLGGLICGKYGEKNEEAFRAGYEAAKVLTLWEV